MSNGFTNGLLGIPSGGSQNAAGLIYNSMMRKQEDSTTGQPEFIEVPCSPGEVKWHAKGDCFTPGQLHINIAVMSITVNVILLVGIMVCVMRKRGRHA